MEIEEEDGSTTEFCCNDLCDNEAVTTYKTADGRLLHLCLPCSQMFEWGQIEPDATLEEVR
jgi:hypothetical protein